MGAQLTAGHVTIDQAALRDFCERWKIVEFSVFGSVLRDDFRPDSDVDVLVTFAENARWRLGDLVQMRVELSGLLGRDVDIVERRAVEENPNWIIRRAILDSARQVDVA